MSSITEQISATGKSQLESQLNFLNSVLKNTVDVAGQVVALNLSTARNAAERSTAAARQLIEAKDARAVLDLARPMSAIEGLVAYQRELFSIATQTQQALFQTASDRLRDAPASKLVLVSPAASAVPFATQISESAVNAAVAANNAAAEAAQSATDGDADAASRAAHAASDAAQAATSSTADAARATTEEIDDAAEATRVAQDTTEASISAATDATQATAAATQDAAQEATHDAADAVDNAASDSAAAARETLARAAAAVTAATDAVSAATERLAGAAAAAQAPAPVTAASAPLFDSEPATQKSARGRQAGKPAPEAKSAPGKSRK